MAPKDTWSKLHAASSATADARRRNISWLLATAGLCLFFYMLGAWQQAQQQQSLSSIKIDSTRVHVTRCQTDPSNDSSSQSNRPKPSSSSTPEPELDFAAHHSGGQQSTGQEEDDEKTVSGVPSFEPCDLKLSEYTPCEDIERSLRFDRDRLIYRERHCPGENERLRCLIPAPPGYRNPFSWPRSRDYAWYANVPHKELTIEKAVQNWIQYEGDRFHFPGGGTMFPRGAGAYIDEIAAIVPLDQVRTALDTGCGVASFGAYLLNRKVLTMSFAPRDTHEGQVQFALERGVPAMLGVMASQRLPYPARAFELAHCSRCLIPWKDYEGIYLIEVDRVLRPGGYWVLSGPPVNWKTHWKGWQRSQEDLSSEMSAIEDLARRLCWKKVAEKGNLAVWQKPLNHVDCLRSKRRSSPLKNPPMCDTIDPDQAWYKQMEPCISALPSVADPTEVAGGALAVWPQRLTMVPPRIATGSVPGVTAEDFTSDVKLWSQRLQYYTLVVPPLGHGRYRNIIDMSAGLGGFAGALATDERVWVMNTVPPANTTNAPYPSSLGVIYERGLIGVYHDWCEAFSTYPRTYDLLHANRLFSTYKSSGRCDIVDILLEMDRILRPEGAVIIRDEVDVLTQLSKIATGLRWDSRLVDHETGPFNTEKIMVAVKTYWVGSTAQQQQQQQPEESLNS